MSWAKRRAYHSVRLGDRGSSLFPSLFISGGYVLPLDDKDDKEMKDAEMIHVEKERSLR